MIKDISKIIPYYNELQKYCYILTGTKWDGEDLLQETIIKVLNKFPIDKRDMNNISKAYLFRISTNTWIDQCRKKKIVIEDFDENKHSSEEDIFPSNVIDAIERLLHYLKPKSAVIVLLIDVFQFTIKETTNMLGDTNEGAVKTALRRARVKLANLKKEKNSTISNNFKVDISRLIDDFTKGILIQDPIIVVESYKMLKSVNINVERKVSENRIFYTFSDIEGNILMVSR